MVAATLDGRPVDTPRTADDVRSIRRDCATPELWQEQLLTSLMLSSWTFSMLVWVPVGDPLHWFHLLEQERNKRRRNFDPSFERESEASTAAIGVCGGDRERWLLLCLHCLEDRGWRRTMMSSALQLPRTNIIRRLENAKRDSSEAPKA